MRVLVDQIKASTPRPKSPHMNNEEPIKNSHYPAGEQPEEGTEAPIERPDFPAPPYYAAERRKKKRKRGRAQRYAGKNRIFVGPTRGAKGPWAFLICRTMEISVFSTNAQSKFASVVLGGVLLPERLARHIYVVPLTTYEAS